MLKKIKIYTITNLCAIRTGYGQYKFSASVECKISGVQKKVSFHSTNSKLFDNYSLITNLDACNESELHDHHRAVTDIENRLIDEFENINN